MPTPTDQQISVTREMLGLNDFDLTKSLIEAVNDAEWTLHLTDIETWSVNRGEVNDIKRVGSIEFFELGSNPILASLRNSARARFGLTPLSDSASWTEAGRAGSRIETTLKYF